MTFTKLFHNSQPSFLTLLVSFSLVLVNSAEEQQASAVKASSEPQMIDAPGLNPKDLVGPLAEMMNKLSPEDDGWTTEALSSAASAQLYKLADILKSPKLTSSSFAAIADENFTSSSIIPNETSLEISSFNEFQTRRLKVKLDTTESHSPLTLKEIHNQLRSAYTPDEKLYIATKVYKVSVKNSEAPSTDVLIEIAGKSPTAGRRQINAEWRCYWIKKNGKLLLSKIELLNYQDVTLLSLKGKPLFSDQTEAAFGKNSSLRKQLLHSTDHWRSRIPQSLGLDVVANVGFIMADFNGDKLEDLYICQQGGLPNLLYLRKTDGTYHDASEKSGANWLDFTPSALALDLDADGDKDLIVALQFELLLMRNDGNATFELANRIPLLAQTFSLSAADYDLDGDLDLFACGYNPSEKDLEESGALGSPTPFHDANNGGQNTLLKNNGDFKFSNATKESGLDTQNNTRFSFAAAWEDYDRDGDPDLYVANDYGRNNLYRNDNGKFIDVAGELEVEDMSSGMSVSWGDVNRDGRSDLYVSNMFSSAGNRITYQTQFQNGEAGKALNTFKRFARGNTLFLGSQDNGFIDRSTESGATMARWSWGSRLADLNNDGWEDILAANGFITTEDTGDL